MSSICDYFIKISKQFNSHFCWSFTNHCINGMYWSVRSFQLIPECLVNHLLSLNCSLSFKLFTNHSHRNMGSIWIIICTFGIFEISTRQCKYFVELKVTQHFIKITFSNSPVTVTSSVSRAFIIFPLQISTIVSPLPSVLMNLLTIDGLALF